MGETTSNDLFLHGEAGISFKAALYQLGGLRKNGLHGVASLHLRDLLSVFTTNDGREEQY